MMLLKIIPTHQLANWLINTIDGLLNHLGLENHQIAEEVIYIFVISLLSVLIGICLKIFILFITNKIVAHRQTPMVMELKNRQVFLKCSHIIPPLVFMALIPFAFNADSHVLHWIYKIVGIYALCAFAVGLNSILKFIFDRYNLRDNHKNLPVKGVLNIAIGIVWIIISILSVCILLDKSPGTLLAGLGVFATALMLIFKDSILGFVAGVQMSDNDMVRVGDWIVVPNTPANGIVTDVSLSTVKILNWDYTTALVPPYTLVSGGFQNYRSMYDTGARRIENQFIIEAKSVKPLSDTALQEIVTKYPELQSFVDNLKQKNVTYLNTGDQRSVKGTIETNLGIFRAYVCQYLSTNPDISADQRVMVRIMQNTNAGIPLQIWCFTATTDWDEYEAIQSRVMEHLSAVAADFEGLEIYSANSINLSSQT